MHTGVWFLNFKYMCLIYNKYVTAMLENRRSAVTVTWRLRLNYRYCLQCDIQMANGEAMYRLEWKSPGFLLRCDRVELDHRSVIYWLTVLPVDFIHFFSGLKARGPKPKKTTTKDTDAYKNAIIKLVANLGRFCYIWSDTKVNPDNRNIFNCVFKNVPNYVFFY